MKYAKKILWIAIGLLALVASAEAAVHSVSVRPLSPEAGRASVYEVRLTLTQTFPSAGSLTLEFPQDFDLSQAILAGSPNVKGGFKVFVDGRRVRIQRSGLGPAVPAGTEMIVRLANVRNPKSTGQFSVKLDVQAGKQILGTADGVAFSILPKKKIQKAIR